MFQYIYCIYFFSLVEKKNIVYSVQLFNYRINKMSQTNFNKVTLPILKIAWRIWTVQTLGLNPEEDKVISII